MRCPHCNLRFEGLTHIEDVSINDDPNITRVIVCIRCTVVLIWLDDNSLVEVPQKYVPAEVFASQAMVKRLQFFSLTVLNLN